MGFCKGLRGKVRTIIQKVDDVLDSHSDIVIGIANKVKAALNDPIVGLITDLIPGNLDNTIRATAIAALDKTIDELAIIDSCKQFTTPQEKWQCFVTEVGKKHPSLQQAIVFKLASLLLNRINGGQLSQHEYDLITQAKYVSTK